MRYSYQWITLDGQKVLGGGYYHWYMAHIPQELISKLGFQGAYHNQRKTLHGGGECYPKSGDGEYVLTNGVRYSQLLFPPRLRSKRNI